MNNRHDILSQVTIVIPMYNYKRYKKLIRLLKFIELYIPTAHILVLDSGGCRHSENFLDKAIKKNILRYIEYDENTDFTLMIYKGLCSIDSKYSVVCSDDDFIFPNGIQKSVEFLECNPDYSVAHGQYVSFLKDKGIFYWNKRYDTPSVLDENPLDRVLCYFERPSSQNFYGVYRAGLHRSIMKNAAMMTDLRFGEHMQCVLALVHGKEKRLNILHYAREKVKEKMPLSDLDTYINNGTFDTKYSKFKNILINYLKYESDLSIEDVEKRIDKAIYNFIQIKVDRRKKSIYELIVSIIRKSSFFYNLINLMLKRGSVYERTMLTDNSMCGIYKEVEIIKNHVLDKLPESE